MIAKMMFKQLRTLVVIVVVLAVARISTATTHYILPQYISWYGHGCFWDGHLNTDNYITPVAGQRYDSADPNVAERHIQQMLTHGITGFQYMWDNKRGDGSWWCGTDPDEYFQKGMMQAKSFDKIKFIVFYEPGCRAMGVNRVEREGKDVIPGITWHEPIIGKPIEDGNQPSYDFSLKSIEGKYFYDELFSHDIDYIASTYMNLPNYIKVDGKAVLVIYDCWRFNNGSEPDQAAGFKRALLRVRTEVYEKYNILLYIAGDFPRYTTTYEYVAGFSPEYYKNLGFLEQYDAIASINYTDYNWFNVKYIANKSCGSPGDIRSLADFTAMAESVSSKWHKVTFSTKRAYRGNLPKKIASAYGSENVRLDFFPFLSFSYAQLYTGDKVASGPIRYGYWSYGKYFHELNTHAEMVKKYRDISPCAEEDVDIILPACWNQFGEGQILEEVTFDIDNPYPLHFGNRYLNVIKKALAMGEESFLCDLTGHWRFEEGKGNKALDASIFCNDGTIHGTASWVNGKNGGALSFNGSDNYVDCGNDDSLNPNEFSVAFWMKGQKTSDGQRIITKNKYEASIKRGWLVLWGDQNNKLGVCLFDKGSRERSVYTIGWPQNQWVHTAFTYKYPYLTVYRDGKQLCCEDVGAWSYAPATSEPLRLGRGYVPSFYRGQLDDIYIYGRCLSLREIKQLKQENTELKRKPILERKLENGISR
jgi:hypothetical protein